jgi:hypothetical protein
VHIGANRVWHPSAVEGGDRISFEQEFKRAYAGLVGNLIQVDHDTLNIQFGQMLQRFVGETGSTEDTVLSPEESLERGHTHMKMLIDEVMTLAETDPKTASALLEFAVSGWGLREETERQVGLSQADAPRDFLYMEWSGLLKSFPHYEQDAVREYFDTLRKKTWEVLGSLRGMALEKLALDLPQHTQLKEYIEARPASKPLEETKADFDAHLALFDTDILPVRY